jgi:hypothetical protein
MKILETKAHYNATPCEIFLHGRDNQEVQLGLQPPGRRRGRGGARNIILTVSQAKILAYALLTEAERASAKIVE